MHRNTKLLALAAIVALFGCATSSSEKPQPLVKTTRTCNSTNPCTASVTITDPSSYTATVDPEMIVVQQGHKTRIFWKLPENCAFVSAYGDGVFVKTVAQAVDAADQFDEQMSVEAVANNPKRMQISSLYYWFAKNGKKSTDGGYVYRVVFHCKSGNTYDPRAFVADPIIFNDGP